MANNTNQYHNLTAKELPIKHLNLWDENARFPEKYFKKSEKELVTYFLKNKSFEIEKFATEVVKDFDLPQLEKLVVWEDNNKYIVLEGNRRLITYKLLVNPQLAQDSKIQKIFNELKKSIQIDENFTLEVLVTKEKNDGFRYIDRKHNKGNNEVTWGPVERSNFAQRRPHRSNKDITNVELANSVKKLLLPSEIIESVLGKGYVTTLYRIIDSQPAQKKLGYEVNEDGKLVIKSQKEFDDLLKIIVFNVWKKKSLDGKLEINSRSLNDKNSINNYLSQFNSSNVSDVDMQINQKHTKVDMFGDKRVAKSNDTTERSKRKPIGLFFPSDIPYKLTNTSLRRLYDELKDIPVETFPNAAHDLLRSFLECSLAEFLTQIGKYKKVQANDAHIPKLSEMLTYIINNRVIDDDHIIDNLKEIKSNWNEPYSLQRMNNVNHNKNYTSAESDVRVAWGKMESLFKVILNPDK